jgi:hypothetical protein
MSDTIDRYALRQAMYHMAFETDSDTMWKSGCWVRYRAVEQVIKSMPTADSEIIRCKDCKHWDDRTGRCVLYPGIWEGDDYCSKVERKEK